MYIKISFTMLNQSVSISEVCGSNVPLYLVITVFLCDFFALFVLCRHDSTMQDIVYKLLPHIQEGMLCTYRLFCCHADYLFHNFFDATVVKMCIWSCFCIFSRTDAVV